MKIVLVSHGSFSKGLSESAQMIMGEQEKFVAYGLYPEQEATALKEKIEEEFKKTDEGEEILVLSDLFHGSPFNTVVSLMENYDVYHVTGINLAMVIEAIMERYSGSSAAQICERLMEMPDESVKDVRKMLQEEEEDNE